MSATVGEIVRYAYLKCNVIDESTEPTAEQGQVGLVTLNNMLSDMAADGVHLGWYPSTNLANTAPLQEKDIKAVKLLLTAELAAHYGIDLAPLLVTEIGIALTRLKKRALRYSEADMSELPRAQGPGWRAGAFWG